MFVYYVGSGKTTLLSQLSVDFAEAGKPVLWGSFEIKTKVLMRKMVQQFYKTGELKKLTTQEKSKVMKDFDNLPIKFMRFHGASDIDEVMSEMDKAVVYDDIQHIIIDNLQFMMPRIGDDSSSTAPSTSTSNKKSSARTGVDFLSGNIFSQDKIVDKLRSFATAKNVS